MPTKPSPVVIDKYGLAPIIVKLNALVEHLPAIKAYLMNQPLQQGTNFLVVEPNIKKDMMDIETRMNEIVKDYINYNKDIQNAPEKREI